MAKRKTSRKRGLSFNDMPAVRLKPGAPVEEHHPKEALRDVKFIARALTEALLDGDADAFKEILAGHLASVQKESFYRKAGVSRRTLFRMLAPGGNPTLENITRVVKALSRRAA